MMLKCSNRRVYYSSTDIPSIDAETESVGRKDSDVDSMVTGQRDARSRGGSMNEPVSSATPGSQTSSTSSDSGECLFFFFFIYNLYLKELNSPLLNELTELWG